MHIFDWLRPGVGIKRWVLLAFFCILLMSVGINLLLDYSNGLYGIFQLFTGILLTLGGVLGIIVAVRFGLSSLFSLIESMSMGIYTLTPARLSELILEKRILVKGPKIVVIGGGTGLSALLRGLKQYTSNITAVVTVADDGGGSGQLRQDMGIIPPGDIRNCIVALANVEPIMKDLLQYRFREGALKGQSFGNLLIAAMSDICDGFEEAIQQVSNVLAVTGKVLPVTLEDVSLRALLEDGTEVQGESKIPVVQSKRKSRIKKVTIHPGDCKPLPDVLEAIRNADAIILGPGSLYTSIIPNLLVKDIPDAIRRSRAMKIYVANVMTQPGETQGYTVSDHIEAIREHGGDRLIEYVVVNNNFRVSKTLLQKYKDDGAEPVRYDVKKLREKGIVVVERDLMRASGELIRHSSDMLAKTIMELILNKRTGTEWMKGMEYYRTVSRLKKRDL